jgi:hypothetical protein
MSVGHNGELPFKGAALADGGALGAGAGALAAIPESALALGLLAVVPLVAGRSASVPSCSQEHDITATTAAAEMARTLADARTPRAPLETISERRGGPLAVGVRAKPGDKARSTYY